MKARRVTEIEKLALQPRVKNRLRRFAARKNVNDLSLLLNLIVQDFLDTHDHKFTEEERRRWNEQAENLGWPEPATTT